MHLTLFDQQAVKQKIVAVADIVVVGAGPAGLMAAWKAAQDGHRCTVLEAGDHVGGMAASFEVAGQRVDYGSHRLHPAAPPLLLADLGGLLGSDLQTRERNGRIRLHDRWIGFPLRASDMIRHLPLSFSARAALDAATGPFRRTRGDSFVDEVAARLGRIVAETFYTPYARKLYGVPAADLDAELAHRRVSATSALAIARRLVRATRPSGRTFLYPRHGYGQIADRMAGVATDLGVHLHLETPVERITVEPDGVTVSAGGRTHAADVVLSTIPVGLLAHILDPQPPPELLASVERCRTRAMLLAYLVVDQDQYTPFDAHYLPGPDTRVARLSEPKNYRDGSDPVGRTVLCAEIACWAGDDIWTWSDDDVGALVVRDLEASGLPRPRSVATEVRRLRSVYPVYEKTTMADRAAVDAWTTSLDRVVTLGRQGLAVPDNLHHVLAMGAAAAHAVNPGDSIEHAAPIDHGRWSRSLASFVSHVVED